ncbi:MAG: methyl-accepting chemotaxis protein [Pelosinus sp.]|nr:methyl-accepting chemotaxis protein [Pelosinus sp.]
MKIGVKIAAGFAIVLFIMCISSGIGMYLIRDMNNTSSQLQSKNLVLQQKSNDLVANSTLKIAAMRGFVITGKIAFLNEYNKLYSKGEEIIQTLLKESDTEEEQQYVQEIKSLNDKCQKVVMEKVVPLKRNAQMNEVMKVMSDELTPLDTELLKKQDEYIKLSSNEINGAFARARASGQKALVSMLLMIIIAVIIGAAIAYVITRSVTRPFNAAVSYLEKIAGGDFSIRISPRFLALKDETGDMAKAMDKMLVSIRAVLTKLASSAEVLAASSEQLMASTEQSVQASSQVAVSITQVYKGAQHQLELVDSTTKVVGQISEGIEQVADNAQCVSDSAAKTAEAASSGEQAVGKAVNQMTVIEQKTKETAHVISELDETSNEIGQIVDSIANIAGQTNLLALNAAIEAARAGEQGRGFAVVADEVRKLAEQSERAAKQIAELITEVQQKTNNAVAFMNEGKKEVEVGSKVVNEAGDSFREIIKMIYKITEQIHEISAAIQELTSGSQDVKTSVQQIDQESKNTAEQTETVSAATEEQSASMEEISTSSQALSKMAEELQSIIRNFKV